MKKILLMLSMLLIGMQMNGENKYFPTGTTWKEESRFWGERDTITYVVGEEVMKDGVAYNEVLRNGNRHCLLREEGPLVFMWIDEYENGLLYDFDWWEGKDYVIDFPDPFGGEFYQDVMSNIEEKVMMDGQTYKIWAPYQMCDDYIICGVGGTNSILGYYYPLTTGGTIISLLEFTRNGQLIFSRDHLNGIQVIDMELPHESRPIRLKRNEIGGYDLQVKSSDGTWQMVK